MPTVTDSMDGKTATTTGYPPFEPDDEHMLNAGAVVAGRYKVIERVGSGGMGHVYRAVDETLGRDVALKRLRFTDAAAEQRLADEARAMAQLNDPNVVAIYDVISDVSGLTLAMEYVDGTTLREWLSEPRPWRPVLDAVLDAAAGLAAAHRAGFVHRDFKPSNVLVAADGTVKVTDFGLAKFDASGGVAVPDAESPAPPQATTASTTTLTQTGTVMGTPRYMAPEQHRGARADARSDQFSLCVSLWEGLAGKPPFPGTRDELADQKLAGPPAWPAALDVPPWIVAAIERGLSPAPEDRWPTVDALHAALSGARPRLRRLWAVTVGVVLVGGIAWGWSALRPSACPEFSITTDHAARVEGVGDAIRSSAEPFAAETARTVERVLADYARRWAGAAADNCEATRVRAEQPAEQMDRAAACLRRASAQFESALDALGENASPDALAAAPNLLFALPDVDLCRDPNWLSASVTPPAHAAQRKQVDTARQRLASLEASVWARDAEAAVSSLSELREEAVTIGFSPLVAEVDVALGNTARTAGQLVVAKEALERAYAGAVRAGDDHTAAIAARSLALVVGFDLSEPEEGLRMIDAALALDARDGAAPLEGILARSVRGLILPRVGRQDEGLQELRSARAASRELLEPDHPARNVVTMRLGVALFNMGRNEEAQVLYREALDVARARWGDDHPRTALHRSNLALALQALGQLDEALTLLDRARSSLESVRAEQHPDLARIDLNRSVVYAALGDNERSLEMADAALAALTVDPEQAGPMVAQAHRARGIALEQLGRLSDASTAYAAAATVSERSDGTELGTAMNYRIRSIRTGMLAGELPDAAQRVRALLERMNEILPPEHADVALAWETLGEAELAAGRSAEAVDAFGRAMALIETGELRGAAVGVVRFKLAQAVAADGDPARGRALATRAREEIANTSASYASDRAMLVSIDDWLSRHANARPADPAP